MSIKKTITLTLGSEQKERLERLAKRHGLSTNAYLRWLIDSVSEEARPVTLVEHDKDLPEQVRAMLKGEAITKMEGSVNVATKPDANTVFYSPEAIFVPVTAFSEKLKIPKAAVEKILGGFKEYRLLNPRRHEPLLRNLVKTLNVYALGGCGSLKDAVRKVFKTEAKGIILVRPLDPLRLTKFCEANAGKKVVYLLSQKE